MSRFSSLPIRLQLLALAVMLTLPALGVILYSGVKERNQHYKDAVIETQKLADNLAARQESIITEAQLLASLLADLSEVNSRDFPKVQKIITSINSRNRQYKSILIADKNGIIWASSIPGMYGVSVSERRYFKNARTTMLFSSGEYAEHKILNIPTISMAYPLAKNGTFDGVIILSYDLGVMRSILYRSQLPSDTNYRIFDHNGVIISNWSESGFKAGETLPIDQFRKMQEGEDRVTGTIIRHDNDQRIFTSRKLWLNGESSPYMFIRTTISANKARAESKRNMLLNFSMLLPFAASAFLLALYIGKRSITDRVKVLCAASEEIANGNLDVRVTSRITDGELGVLARSFDEMADKLANDIRMREQADAYLNDAMQRLELATASGHLGIWDWDIDKDSMIWNERMFELYSVNPDSFTASVDAWVNRLHPEDKDRAMAECLASLNGENQFDTVFRVIHPDGSIRQIKANAIVARNGAGKAVRMIGINRDITDEKRMKDALEHRLVALTSPMSATGEINFEDLFNVEEIQKIQDSFAEATGVASIITDVNGVPITRPSNFCPLCENIIRKTEKGLANCYRSDAALGKMNPDGPIMQPCLSGGLWDGGASINVGDHHIANWLIGQVLDESCDIDTMMDYAREIGADEEAYRTALGSVTRMSLQQFSKICQSLYMIANQLSKQALQNVQQAKYITERVNAEEALKREQLLTNAIFDSVPGLLYLYDDQGKLIRWNRKHETITGYSAEELSEMILTDWYRDDEDTLKAINDGVTNCLEEGYAEARGYLQKKDGTKILFSFTAVRLEINGRIYFAGIGIDISEREKMQNELLKIQKLESLGVLAAGIAHDFNNVLTGIMGNISFAKMVIDDSHEAFIPLEKAEKASMRAAELAKKLLIFTKGGAPIKKPVSIQNIIQETMAQLLDGTPVKGKIEFTGNFPVVEADEAQIKQVFHNIINNALQSMPDGGTLTIHGDKVDLTDESSTGVPSGAYVRIDFTDNGCGIPEVDQKKIFDPYFTTKAGSSGLGLASSHAIISKHNGSITVESAEGSGSTFSIYLPISSSAQDQNKKTELTARLNAHRRILVMDDEEMVREFASMILARAGYTTVTCVNGEEAIDLYRASMEAGATFTFVIMDLTIPGGMGGVEAARCIKDIDSNACLIVSSGYSDDPAMANFRDYGFCAAMPKPYKAETIELALSECNDSKVKS